MPLENHIVANTWPFKICLKPIFWVPTVCQAHAFSYKQFCLILVAPQWNNFHLVGERWWATQLRYRILNFMSAFNLFFHFLHPIVCFWRAEKMPYLSLYLKNERKMCCFSNDVNVPSLLAFVLFTFQFHWKQIIKDSKILYIFFNLTNRSTYFLKRQML